MSLGGLRGDWGGLGGWGSLEGLQGFKGLGTGLLSDLGPSCTLGLNV